MNNIFKLQRNSNDYKLTKLKKKTYVQSDYFEEYEKLRDVYRKKNIINWDFYLINSEYYVWQLFNINLNKTYSIASNNIDNKFFVNKLMHNGATVKYIDKVTKIKIKNNYSIIFSNLLPANIFNKIRKYNYCKREELLYKYRLYTLYYLFDLLKKNGKFVITLYGYCDETIEILYLLTLMFDYIYIFKNSEVICFNFNSQISKNKIKNLINNKFSIQPKYQLDELINYFKTTFNNETMLLKYKLNEYEDFYNIYSMGNLLTMFYYMTPYKKNDIYRYILFYFNQIYDLKHKKLLISDAIFNNEVYKYIITTITNYNCKKCLELGMGFGLYSFYILSNNKTNLVSIDPNQKKSFDYGVKLLKEFKFDKRHLLFRHKSNKILPKIIKKYKENYFDFIFVDLFYNNDLSFIDPLLKINGVLILHNINSQQNIDMFITSLNYKKIFNNYVFYVLLKLKNN
jgi:hypothetical protein